LYVLDEPTIGLHPRDNAALLDTLVALRDQGNSVVIVEHDDATIKRADHLIDLGPGAGKEGGEVVFAGSPTTKAGKTNSATLKAIGEPAVHPLRGERRKLPAKTSKTGWISIKGATANNLKNIAVAIPLQRLSVLTGISGSGKSSFMRGVLAPAVDSKLKKPSHQKKTYTGAAKTWKTITGANTITAVYEVDQSPIGKTSRSCPATYVKVFDEVRKLFANLPESRVRGFEASRFSFNTEGGRCETCGGNGRIKLEMNFLPTTWVDCDDCHGARYNDATLEVHYNGKTIAEVMDMSIAEACDFFDSHPKINITLRLLRDTGLGYLSLGQPSPTLSGGEAQRIKLVAEIRKGQTRARNALMKGAKTAGGNLYLIEEPTIGLHLADVTNLIGVLHALVDEGHTVVVIEHNTDVMAEADYMIDIGPEAGGDGGTVVAKGTPEEVVKVKASRTAPFLGGVLG
jgi:excinuclease ABC subunit A